MRKIIVVGDSYSEFARTKSNVFTISEMDKGVWEDDFHDVTEISVGQGVEYFRIASFMSVLKMKSTHQVDLKYHFCLDQVKPDHRKSVHKAKSENISISHPVKNDESTYSSWLVIQDNNELMKDHMTGQHIQGMVLIEAARQMMLSVCENYILENEENYYFALNSVTSKFSSFAFPIPTKITLNSKNTRNTLPGKFSSDFEITFIQNDKEVTKIEISFSAYQNYIITRKENEMASSSVELFMKENVIYEKIA